MDFCMRILIDYILRKLYNQFSAICSTKEEKRHESE